jgi:hypothetical protein
MAALFDPANRAETDRSGEIRAARQAEAMAAAEAAAALPAPARDGAPSRRAVLTGGLVAQPAAPVEAASAP